MLVCLPRFLLFRKKKTFMEQQRLPAIRRQDVASMVTTLPTPGTPSTTSWIQPRYSVIRVKNPGNFGLAQLTPADTTPTK